MHISKDRHLFHPLTQIRLQKVHFSIHAYAKIYQKGINKTNKEDRYADRTGPYSTLHSRTSYCLQSCGSGWQDGLDPDLKKKPGIGSNSQEKT